MKKEINQTIIMSKKEVFNMDYEEYDYEEESIVVSKPANKECSICVEKYNKSTRKVVICELCNYESCASCWKQYLLGSLNEPHCMSCKKPFTKKFLVNNFTKSWCAKQLKAHREDILLEHQKALLPNTQRAAENQKYVYKLDETIKNNNIEIRNLKEQLQELTIETRRLMHEKVRIENNLDVIVEEGTSEKNKDRKIFNLKCPKEDCRGYLSSQYKCGVCETWVCPKCFVIKKEKNDETHTCKDDDIETVKYLKTQTKSCPKCSMSIQKIDGCDMMFCTSCHVAFSWNTGEIHVGNIHNPHYYEWMRNNGGLERQPGDQACGGLITYASLHAFYGNNGTIQKVIRDKLDLVHRFAVDTTERALIGERDIDAILRDLRVKYILGYLDEEKWKQLVHKHTKAHEKNREYRQIIQMYTDTIGDLFRNITMKKTSKEVYDILLEMERLRVYVNTHIMSIREVYNSKISIIKSDYSNL